MSARSGRGSLILTSNKAFREWGTVFGDEVIASALLDRLLHHAIVINIREGSYRLRDRAADLGLEAAAPLAPPAGPSIPAEGRRLAARTTRLLRRLRAHGLIQKVPSTRLYRVTPWGHKVMATALTFRQTAISVLNHAT